MTAERWEVVVTLRSEAVTRILPLLAGDGVLITYEPDGAVHVRGRDARTVREIAQEHGIPLDELSEERSAPHP